MNRVKDDMGSTIFKTNTKTGGLDIGKMIDYLVLTVLGVACLQYAQFYGKLFAQAHIKFDFLGFPIFVGEFLLAGCLVLMAVRFYFSPIPWDRWHVVIAAYLIFVVVKALAGFSEWGALALRDAALFYYPLFAVIGYYCYRSEFFNRWIILLCYAVLLFMCFMKNINDYWLPIRIVLGLVLAFRYPDRRIGIGMIAVMMAVIPYYSLIDTARMLILGQFFGAIFFILSFCMTFKKQHRTRAMLVGFVLCILLASYIFYFSGYRPAQNIFNIPKLIELFQEREREVNEKLIDFKMSQPNEVRLYNPELNQNGKISETSIKELASRLTETTLPSQRYISQGEDKLGNSLFRLMIWRDLRDDLWKEKPFFGFDFGKPFRSIRVESTRAALDEWSRDGWIAIHNSYLNFIYRGGVLGLGFIMAISFVFIRMTLIFSSARDVSGLLLCSGLIILFVASFFGVILELPYTAIPIWCLFGMTMSMAYHKDLTQFKRSAKK